MMITYEPSGINNFHNSSPIRVRVADAPLVDPVSSGDMYEISARQARRIASHFCGITDCRCPHGAVAELDEAGTRFGLPVRWAK